MKSATTPRDLIVTFRLSSHEYILLQRAREGAKSRSLSEYAREAVLQRAETDQRPPQRDPVLPIIAACLERLDWAVNEMNGKLSTIVGAKGGDV